MRLFVLSLAVLIALMLFFPYTAAQAAEKQTVEVAAVGDIMSLAAQISAAHQKSGGYDFKYAFRYAKPILSEADYAIGNLETPVAGSGFGYAGKSKTGYPVLNAPDSLLDTLKDTGFDLVATANNHCLDCGEKGLYNTLKAIAKRKMLSTGTYNTKKLRNTPVIAEVKGIKIAVLSYTQYTNSRERRLSKDKRTYVFNKLSIKTIERDIASARKNGADAVIVMPHWGVEQQKSANAYQRGMAQKIAAAGADIIIGAHPHILQAATKITSKTPYGKKTCFVAYSLGNFISSMTKPGGQDGAIVKFTITKDEKGKVVINNFRCIATHTFGSYDGKHFVVLPYYKVADTFAKSPKTISALKSAAGRVSRIVGAKHIKLQK